MLLGQRQKDTSEGELRTDLGLGHEGGLSVTQGGEGQAELRLSVTLTETEREKILKEE